MFYQLVYTHNYLSLFTVFLSERSGKHIWVCLDGCVCCLGSMSVLCKPTLKHRDGGARTGAKGPGGDHHGDEYEKYKTHCHAVISSPSHSLLMGFVQPHTHCHRCVFVPRQRGSAPWPKCSPRALGHIKKTRRQEPHRGGTKLRTFQS